MDGDGLDEDEVTAPTDGVDETLTMISDPTRLMLRTVVSSGEDGDEFPDVPWTIRENAEGATAGLDRPDEDAKPIKDMADDTEIPGPSSRMTVQEDNERAHIEKLRTELSELEMALKAKRKDLEGKKANIFSRFWSGVTGTTASLQREITGLEEKMKLKRGEIAALVPEEEITDIIPRSKPRAASSLRTSTWLKQAALTLGLAVVPSNIGNNPQEPASESAKSTQTERPSQATVVEAQSPAQAAIQNLAEQQETSAQPETEATLWDHLMGQNQNDIQKTALAKKAYLEKEGHRIMDAADDDWLDDLQADQKAWKAIQKKLTQWGFTDSSFGSLATSIQNSHSLGELLKAERNNANWLEAEVVLMYHPDAWKNIEAKTGDAKTGDAKTGDESAALPNVTTPWNYTNEDGCIDPNLFQDDSDDEEPAFIPSGLPDQVPTPVPNSPMDAPAPVAYLRRKAPALVSKPSSTPEPSPAPALNPMDVPEPTTYLQLNKKD